MNRFENWFCDSSFWRDATCKHLLPWILSGTELGDDILEVGAGPGAATEELRKRTGRVTSLEYSHDLVVKLAQRSSRASADGHPNRAVLQGDAAALPFLGKTFSTVIAVLMLHHMKSPEAQEHAFAEIHRVLRPGGVLLAVEIQDGWLQRIAHIRSTFVPVAPASVSERLTSAGFSNITLNFRYGLFRLSAVRPQEAGICWQPGQPCVDAAIHEP